jgi:hypothetical protein
MAACADKNAATPHTPAAQTPEGGAPHATEGARGLQDASVAAASLSQSTQDSGAATSTDAGALPPPRWATRPNPASSGSPFSYVIDGYCVQAKVAVLSNATLVHYGEYGQARVALATDTGLTDWEPLSRGLSRGTYFGEITGSYPDNLWYGVDVGTRAFSANKYLHYTPSSGWDFAFGADADANISRMIRTVVPLQKGALGVATTCGPNSDGVGCANLGVLAEGTDGPAPPLGTAGFEISRVTPFSTGEVWAFGTACTGTSSARTCTRLVRRWKPGSKVSMDTLGQGEWSGPDSVVGESPGDVTISMGNALLHFDGASWKPFIWPTALLTPQTYGARLFAAPGGVLYLLSGGKLERRNADGTVKAFPTNVPISGLSGVEVGAPWALVSGGVARWDEAEDRWTTFSIPRSPFAWSESKTNVPTIERVWVKSARDVWLSVTYTEWPSHWGEQQFEKRRAILRTLTPTETLRCDTSPDGHDPPLVSAPPLATPECKTPLVLLGRVGTKEKTAFPQSKRIVRNHKEAFAGATFVDFTVGKQRFLGARMPSFEVGKLALAAIRAETPLGRPDMVCAAPEGTAVDLLSP